jgi:hypothetical protein
LRLFSFIDLFPPYFIKLCQNIHPKTPLKCDFFYMSRAKYVHFLVCKLPNYYYVLKKVFYINTLDSPVKFWSMFKPQQLTLGWMGPLLCFEESVLYKYIRHIHPKTPLKCDFFIWAGPNTFTFWSANFQIKLAPLILYTTPVYTSTLKSTDGGNKSIKENSRRPWV